MKFFESFRWRSLAVIIATSGYLVDSGSYYRLWFGFGLGSGVKNPIQWKGLDCYRLLHEAEEELAAKRTNTPLGCWPSMNNIADFG